ncbi:MAG: aminopeptidase N, partial [Candidatus Azotimanducaceae bacterium]
ENKTEAEYLFQYFNAPIYLDRSEALDAWSNNSDKAGLNKITTAALADAFWSLRQKALGMIKGLDAEQKEALKTKVTEMAKGDAKASVRAKAFSVLATLGADVAELEAGLADKSYAVAASALKAVHKTDPEKGIAKAKALEADAKAGLLTAIAGIYAKTGDLAYMDYMQNAVANASGFAKFQMLSTYAGYLTSLDLNNLEAGLVLIMDACENGDPWWIRLGGMQALSNVITHLEGQKDNAEAVAMTAELSEKRTAIKDAETNEQLKGYYAQ